MNIVFKVRTKIIDYLVERVCKTTNYSDPQDIKKVLKKVYFLRSGHNLNITNPTKFTEKIQLYKLYLSSHNYTQYVDKISVREFIKERIGENFLIPILKIWDTATDINFDTLPESFILKTNHGAGMNMIIRNANNANLNKVRDCFSKWLRVDYSRMNGIELQYKGIIPKVYAEKLIVDKNNELIEYKFLCFNGRPYYCMLDIDRFEDHRRNIYDLNWTLQKWNLGRFKNSESIIPKPDNFSDLIKTAEVLCRDFSHVRVDLYNVDGHIYFSELTFTTGSGYSFPYPKQADTLLGSLWNMSL